MNALVIEHGKRFVWGNNDKNQSFLCDEYQIKNYYDTVPDFKEYVDKYATKHHLTVDEALEHSIIKSYLEWYLYNNKCL